MRGARRRLPKAFRIGRIVGRLNAVEGEYPPMAEATAAGLRARLAPDNAALAALAGPRPVGLGLTRPGRSWRGPDASVALFGCVR